MIRALAKELDARERIIEIYERQLAKHEGGTTHITWDKNGNRIVTTKS